MLPGRTRGRTRSMIRRGLGFGEGGACPGQVSAQGRPGPAPAPLIGVAVVGDHVARGARRWSPRLGALCSLPPDERRLCRAFSQQAGQRGGVRLLGPVVESQCHPRLRPGSQPSLNGDLGASLARRRRRRDASRSPPWPQTTGRWRRVVDLVVVDLVVVDQDDLEVAPVVRQGQRPQAVRGGNGLR